MRNVSTFKKLSAALIKLGTAHKYLCHKKTAFRVPQYCLLGIIVTATLLECGFVASNLNSLRAAVLPEHRKSMAGSIGCRIQLPENLSFSHK